MPRLGEVAAIFTIAGGSLALIQLTAIILRLNRRARLTVRIGTVREGTENGRRSVTLQVITTNTGSLSARNILWNYDLPPTFRVLDSETQHHQLRGRLTVARALEHLHPRVETRHELTFERPRDIHDFELRYRIHLEDSRPQTGLLIVKLDGRATD